MTRSALALAAVPQSSAAEIALRWANKVWQPFRSHFNPEVHVQVLVANKSDMDESKRKVPFSKGQALADEFGIRFFETSAKAGTNVNEV